MEVPLDPNQTAGLTSRLSAVSAQDRDATSQ